MKNLLQLIQKVDGCRRGDVEEVVANLLHIHRRDLFLNYDRALSQEGEIDLNVRLERLRKGEPLAYVIGEVEFFGARIKVSPAVLIPRQETELLTEKVAIYMQQHEHEDKTLWDMCCGSGCIGISLKKKFPKLKVVLSDLSPKALEIAKTNASLNNVDVQFHQGDMFAPFEGEKCDFFVCNPPYVSEKDYDALSQEVKHEPKMALIGGTDFYKLIAEQLPGYISGFGCIWMEIGYDQKEEINKMFGYKGSFEKDLAGHDRFFFLEIDRFFKVS